MTTRWYPDTCGCVFDLDGATGEPASIVQVCARHRPADSRVAAPADCRRKNKACSVCDANAALVVTNADGGTTRKYVWSFLSDGTLQIAAPPLTTQQKTTLQTTLQSQVAPNITVV